MRPTPPSSGRAGVRPFPSFAAAGLGLAGALALVPAPVQAQAAFDLDEIVFSATRFPQPRGSIGASVSVIDREALEGAGDRQLSSHLARQPGVSLTQTGPAGAQSFVRIRGAQPQYVAVFVDGIRVDDPTNPQVSLDFGAFLSADVGRVEILRGSQSALWGGSAVGGVINVTTLSDAEMGTTQSVALEAGSYGTALARYGFTHRTEAGALSFNLTHLRSDGFSAADENDGNTDPDGIRATRASLSLRHAVSDTVTLGFSAFVQRTRSEFDNDFGPSDADNLTRRREAGARIFAELSLGASTQEFGLSQYRIRRSLDIPAFGLLLPFEGTRTRLDWLGSTPVSPELTLVYGADITRERSEIGGQTPRTDVYGAFVQGLWAPRQDLDVSVTGRLDRNSDFGTFATGRASVVWRADGGLALRASVARGFRAPSVYERFGDAGLGIAPAPGLTPETSRSAEIGADYTLAGGARLSATLFRLDVRNAITYCGAFATPCAAAPAAPFTNAYENRPGSSKRQGLELEAAMPLGARAVLAGNYTYTSARAGDGTRLGRVPRHELGMAVETQITERLSNTTTVRAMSNWLDRDGLDRMPTFAVVNTSFAWALSERAELTLRIDNLFDRQYQLARGFGTSDRAVYVGVTSRF